MFQVTPFNDHDPVWDSSYGATPTYTKTLKEDDPVGELVHILSATDADDGVDGELKYTVTDAIAGKNLNKHSNYMHYIH